MHSWSAACRVLVGEGKREREGGGRGTKKQKLEATCGSITNRHIAGLYQPHVHTASIQGDANVAVDMIHAWSLKLTHPTSRSSFAN